MGSTATEKKEESVDKVEAKETKPAEKKAETKPATSAKPAEKKAEQKKTEEKKTDKEAEKKPAEKKEEKKTAEKKVEDKPSAEAEKKAEEKPAEEVDKSEEKPSEKVDNVQQQEKTEQIANEDTTQYPYDIILKRAISTFRGPSIELLNKPFGGKLTVLGCTGDFYKVQFVRAGFGSVTAYVLCKEVERCNS